MFWIFWPIRFLIAFAIVVFGMTGVSLLVLSFLLHQRLENLNEKSSGGDNTSSPEE
jgi:hypothetical protein